MQAWHTKQSHENIHHTSVTHTRTNTKGWCGTYLGPHVWHPLHLLWNIGNKKNTAQLADLINLNILTAIFWANISNTANDCIWTKETVNNHTLNIHLPMSELGVSHNTQSYPLYPFCHSSMAAGLRDEAVLQDQWAWPRGCHGDGDDDGDGWTAADVCQFQCCNCVTCFSLPTSASLRLGADPASPEIKHIWMTFCFHSKVFKIRVSPVFSGS